MLIRRLQLSLILVLLLPSLTAPVAHGASPRQSAPLTNTDIMDLKRAGVGDEVIVLRIRSGPTRFTMDAADIVALKSAGVSDAVMSEMLKPKDASANAGTSRSGSLDLSKGALILPFDSSVDDPDAAGLPHATRTAIIALLQSKKMFPAVGGPAEASEQKPWVEISATLVNFAGGSVAKRIIVGLGSGRANAGFDFVVKEGATGKVLWKKTIKETASFWSNSASSSAQRAELPEKVAKSFVEQLTKAKLPAAK